jgi:hypothetical protein
VLRHRVMHVLVIDKGARPAQVTLTFRDARGAASVERLRASSAAAEHGVTFAGQSLNDRGRWVGRKVVQRVGRGHGGAYRISVPGYSAALMSVRLGS